MYPNFNMTSQPDMSFGLVSHVPCLDRLSWLVESVKDKESELRTAVLLSVDDFQFVFSEKV
jgi:hypothetical protein